MATYRDDPRWIIAKYPGRDARGASFPKGARVLYYPKSRTILTGQAAEQAMRDFESQAFDDANNASL